MHGATYVCKTHGYKVIGQHSKYAEAQTSDLYSIPHALLMYAYITSA